MLWLSVFLILPMAFIVVISFLSRGDYGQVGLPFTFENYSRVAGFGWLGYESVYPMILLRSALLASATALTCLLLGLPLALFIVRLSGRLRTAAVLLVVIPFWTNLLIRTYAWQLILSPGSLLAITARRIGIVGASEALYPSYAAVLAGMVCDFLPFMVLPLYASLEKVDWTVAEAAMDLGASRYQVFRHATLPQIYPGLIAGLVLVFLPAAGQFVIPDLLGGAKTVMLGNAIQQQFGQSRDWPFGSALAVLALIIVTFAIWRYPRTSGQTGGEIL